MILAKWENARKMGRLRFSVIYGALLGILIGLITNMLIFLMDGSEEYEWQMGIMYVAISILVEVLFIYCYIWRKMEDLQNKR